MFFLISTNPTRPSLLTKSKDEKYHSDFARFCLGQVNNFQHNKYLENIDRNKRFYKGDQWIFQEDTDTFLKDDDNQQRNRLSIVQNTIRPMVEQYRGNAIRMNINFAVKSISPKAVNRREVKLAKMLTVSKIANQPDNPFGPAMKKQYAIGDSEAETRATFNNTYVDDLVEDVNMLAKYVSDRNKFVQKQMAIAMSMSMNGIAIMHDFEYAGHQEFKIVPAENFYWDRSAKEHDLSDSFFMGHFEEMFPTEIFERFPDISEDDRRAIDNYSKFYSASGPTQLQGQDSNKIGNGKVPVFFNYWMDGQYAECGYVKDPSGYEYFTRINYTYPGEKEPRYTDKDLIKSNSEKAKKLLGDRKKRRIYYDELRTAILIPKEILGVSDENQKLDREKKLNDVVLDWGLSPYQETEVIEYNSVKFPYKVDTWAYLDGEVLSPIDDAIDPQRFINRIWSVGENMINNMPGTSMFYDKSLLGGTSDSELVRNVKQSKPVGFEGRGRGIQNAVQQFDGSKALSTYAGLTAIIDSMKASIKETTGVNDAIQGGSVGSGNDQLVGVTQLMIQRGSLMQEPFYNAVTNVFQQCFDSIISRGKRIYADNDRNLTMAVGDYAGKVIKLTKDHKMEDFRGFVKRENSDDILQQAANQMLITLRTLPTGPLIDDKRMADLWNRSNPDAVARALREYAAEKEETNKMAQKDQKAQEQNMFAMAQQQDQKQEDMMREQAAMDDIKYITDKKVEMNKEALKAATKLATDDPTARKFVNNSIKNLENGGI